MHFKYVRISLPFCCKWLFVDFFGFEELLDDTILSGKLRYDPLESMIFCLPFFTEVPAALADAVTRRLAAVTGVFLLFDGIVQ